MNKTATTFNMTRANIIKNFKHMPLLLKILFGMGLYSAATAAINIISQTPVELNYFGTGLPKNYPLVWHVFSLSMALWGAYVFLNRSYSLLVKYTIVSAILLSLAVSSFFHIALRLADQTERTISIMAIGVVTVVSALLLVYPLKQKKYFDRT